MGTFYKEIAEKKNQKGIKAGLLIGAAIIIIYNIALLGNLEYLLIEFLIVSYAMIITAGIALIYMWIKCSRRYRYTIIDKELIIEGFNRKRRKALLNFNIRQLVSIEKCSEAMRKEKLIKEYNFRCSGNRKEAYRCVFLQDGKLYGFYFEPSCEMVEKITQLSKALGAA